jgi:prepilin-type N-terminal cleavage/methylation domain-containing protein
VRRLARLRQGLADERGYSLVELLAVITILGMIVGSLTTVLVSASKGELDMNRRYRAQEHARMALDKLRREVHCASAISPAGSSSAIALTMPTQCPTTGGVTDVRWCVLAPPGAAAGRYALYRSTGGTCSTSGVRWADYLRTQSIFTYTLQSSQSLGSLGVALEVNIRQTGNSGTFKLSDSFVLRNTLRTCITGSPSPPC